MSPANSVLPVSKRPCRHADLDRHGLARVSAHHRVTRQPLHGPVNAAFGTRQIDLDHLLAPARARVGHRHPHAHVAAARRNLLHHQVAQLSLIHI